MLRRTAVAGLLAGAVVGGGCSLVSTPHRPLRLASSAPRARALETSVAALADRRTRERIRAASVERHPEFTLAFVEFDDQGRFWSRDQVDLLERTLDEENRREEFSGIAVILFAHGWRHTPDVCDENVACFRTFLTQLHSDMGTVARISGGKLRPKRVVAVYAGWRGLSTRVQPFEDLTFWARNRVAHRIADGDFAELLSRVEQFVVRANVSDPDRARVAIIGHSLGGTMVFSALANELKMRAVEASSRGEGSLIRGFGDLIVLVNPAFEAGLYAPLDELARAIPRFSERQTPVLVTVASETDRPSTFWFPLGRWVDTIFQRSGDRSPRRELVTAIGNYRPFWTHHLTAGAPPARHGGPDTFAASARNCGCDLPVEPIPDDEAAYLASLVTGRGRPREAPPGATAPYGRASLENLSTRDPRNPFWVVRASDEVVHGHNGFFTTYLLDFIRRVIIEANAGPQHAQPPAGR